MFDQFETVGDDLSLDQPATAVEEDGYTVYTAANSVSASDELFYLLGSTGSTYPHIWSYGWYMEGQALCFGELFVTDTFPVDAVDIADVFYDYDEDYTAIYPDRSPH